MQENYTKKCFVQNDDDDDDDNDDNDDGDGYQSPPPTEGNTNSCSFICLFAGYQK